MLNGPLLLRFSVLSFSLLLVIGCGQPNHDADTSVAGDNANTKANDSTDALADTGKNADLDSREWSDVREARSKAIQKHLDDNAVAYAWFADFPFGTDASST